MKNTVSTESVASFIAARRLALAGVSGSGKGFGNAVLKELTAKGYDIVPVHPRAASLGGRTAFAAVGAITPPVEGLIVVLPPPEAARMVREAAAAGIRRVWLQQGAESDEALAAAREHGVDLVQGHCILMFAKPHGLHSFHGWLWRTLGLAPKLHAHHANPS
jgi:predicted CoA-binding protein